MPLSPSRKEKGEEMAKKSDREAKAELERRLEEIAQLQQQAHGQGLAFSAPTEEQLMKKIRGESGNSPYIYSQSWTSGTSGGSTAYYWLWAANPDPAGYYPVFVTIFFGLANFFADLGEGIDARDTRWPYISSDGVVLSAGATTNPRFMYTTPVGLPAGTYLGNAVLWRGDHHDRGQYFDRGLFPITLT
jgi:hypothetical protein